MHSYCLAVVVLLRVSSAEVYPRAQFSNTVLLVLESVTAVPDEGTREGRSVHNPRAGSQTGKPLSPKQQTMPT